MKNKLTKEQRRVLLPEDIIKFVAKLAEKEHRTLQGQFTHIVLDYKKKLK